MTEGLLLQFHCYKYKVNNSGASHYLLNSCDLLHQTIGNYFLSFKDSGQISVKAGFKITHGH